MLQAQADLTGNSQTQIIEVLSFTQALKYQQAIATQDIQTLTSFAIPAAHASAISQSLSTLITSHTLNNIANPLYNASIATAVNAGANFTDFQDKPSAVFLLQTAVAQAAIAFESNAPNTPLAERAQGQVALANACIDGSTTSPPIKEGVSCYASVAIDMPRHGVALSGSTVPGLTSVSAPNANFALNLPNVDAQALNNITERHFNFTFDGASRAIAMITLII